MKLNLLTTLFLTFFLFGCGGGGSNGPGSNSPIIITDPSSLYSGKSTAAVLDESNYKEFLSLIFGSNDNISNALAARSISDNSNYTQKTILNVLPILFHSLNSNSQSKLSQRSVSEQEACESGGTIKVTGDVNDDEETGFLNANYINCVIDGIGLNGKVSIEIIKSPGGGSVGEISLNYSNLSIRLNDEPLTITGNLKIEDDDIQIGQTPRALLISNMFIKSNTEEILYENVKTFSNDYNFDAEISGRIYHNAFGFVDIDTESPYSFSSENSVYPKDGGPIYVRGVGNRKLQIVPSGDYIIRVNLDTDIIEGYDRTVDLNYSDSGLVSSSQSVNTKPTINVENLFDRVNTTSTIEIDASKSTDIDNDLIEYLWKIESRPINSTTSLSSYTQSILNFVPDKPGNYEISLKVTDSKSLSDTTVVTVSAIDKPVRLDFNVVDAGFSKSGNKLAVVSSSPDYSLKIIDPVTTLVEQSILLPNEPSAISVTNDGNNIAVGFSKSVGYYPISNISLGSHWPITIDVIDIEASNDGYLYLAEIQEKLYTFNTENQTISESNKSYYLGSIPNIKVRPNSDILYVSDSSFDLYLLKYDISVNPSEAYTENPTYGGYFLEGDLWFSQDGDYALARSGILHTTSNIDNLDMLESSYMNTPRNFAETVDHADHSSLTNQFTAVVNTRSFNLINSEIRTYSNPSLNLINNFSFEGYSLDGNSEKYSEPVFSFFDTSGLNTIVIARDKEFPYDITGDHPYNYFLMKL